MPAQRKLKSPVTLFVAIEEENHEALRRIAFEEKKSLAKVVREIIQCYLNRIWEENPSRKKYNVENQCLVLRTVYLPEGVDDKLRYLAYKKRVSKNKLIREILTEKLSKIDVQ